MAISIGDAVLKITGDTKGLDRSLNEANTHVSTMAQKMQKSLLPVGMAFTAIGAAGLKFVDSARKMNAQLGVTALNLGITTKDMRNLALETTNVTFPLQEVIASFDLLARAGVTSQEEMKNVATAFDTLGDAIGVPAGIVTAQLIPAMKTFNVSAMEMADKTDALTYLFRNTTVSLADFNRMVGYVTPDLVAMGLTTEDMIAILAELEEQGYSGEVMTREFRKAVTLATAEQIPLNEALGISNETIAAYKEELEGATGLTQEYADVANTQYGLMDKLKQKWSELTLELGSFLEPLEPILATMTALGPVMILFGTSMGMAAIKSIAATAAMVAHTIAAKVAAAAQWALNAAMTANPIGIIVLAIGGLITALILLGNKLKDTTHLTKAELEEQSRAYKTEIDKQRQILKTAHDERMRQISDELAADFGKIDAATKALIAPIQAQIDKKQEEIDIAEKAQRDQDNRDREVALKENLRLADGLAEKKDAQQELEEFYASMQVQRLRDEQDALRTGIDDILAAADTEKEILQAQADEEITEAERVKTAKEGFIDSLDAAQQTAHETQMARIRQERAAWHVTPGMVFPIPPLPSDWPITYEKMQQGGIVRKPTLALLGEHGAEAVVPLGGDTTPAGALSNVTINISAGAFMGNEMEARTWARKIHQYLREENRTRTVGITV